MLTEEQKLLHMKLFEMTCADFQHHHCICCRRVSLHVQLNKNKICNRCTSFGDKDYYLKKGALPVWYENGNQNGKPHYKLPEELTQLSTAECMLIQKVAPFVPMQHIKKGVKGLSGHTCSFETDLKGFVKRLPRRHDSATMIRVLRTMHTEIGSDKEQDIRTYIVRKDRILIALQWLQKNNPLYYDIEIDMSSLEWIKGNEGTLEPIVIETDEIHTSLDDNSTNADIGPAPLQAIKPSETGDNVGHFGYIDTGGKVPVSQRDSLINRELQRAVRKSKDGKTVTMDWPQPETVPVNEFGNVKIFAMAFPWLFPSRCFMM